ncbi:SMI1/KNR4 family protein [Streptomyces sp. NPDC004610]|uniref:SMI1/KNR4 family protein n=1 Tax=unclassified Streptomyces TaxID=2593676 RepID=UPI0033A2DC09
MPASSAPLRSLHDFATWEPLLRVVREANAERLAAPGGQVAGRIGRDDWSLPSRRPRPDPGRAARIEDTRDEYEAVERVRAALAEAGVDDISFTTRISPTGEAVLRLLARSPAVEGGIGTPHPGTLLLVPDALPLPWRQRPAPSPGAAPAPTASPEALERILRTRLPKAVPATEVALTETEARLGLPLPPELRALYRVTRARWEDDTGDEVATAVGCELLPLAGLYAAEPSTRPAPWAHAAMEAAVTRPGDAVQGLVGSPGWLVFGDNGGGDRLAVDLTPGPAGHLGQIILIGHEEYLGAELLADSLTDLVEGRRAKGRPGPRREHPEVAYVNVHGVTSVKAAADPDLEVLSLGGWEAPPMTLAPVLGLPRLRSLSAYPGTLADPLEIAALAHLEFLELSPADWRTLLSADAVPRTLLAASVETRGDEDPLAIVELANEILGLWGRPGIVRKRLEGRVGGLEGPRGD